MSMPKGRLKLSFLKSFSSFLFFLLLLSPLGCQKPSEMTTLSVESMD